MKIILGYSIISFTFIILIILYSCDCYGPFNNVEFSTPNYAEFAIESNEYLIAPYIAYPGSTIIPGENFFDSPSEFPFWISFEETIMCHRTDNCSEMYHAIPSGCSYLKIELNILNPPVDEPIDPSSSYVQVAKLTELTIDPTITGDPSGETEYEFESVMVEGEIIFNSISPVVEATFDLWFYDVDGNYRHIKNGWLWAKGEKKCVGN